MRIDFYKRIPRETIPTTFFSIIRNRRRSVAMLSGIILSIALLSGIILYNVELKQDNYDTIVGDFPYEVRFDIMGNEILSEMRKLSDYISSDERVVDTTVIASIYSNVGDNWDEDDEIGLEAIIYPIYENGSVNIQDEDNDADIVFVDSDYFEGEIGKKLLEMDFKGETDLSGNSIIISEQYLNTFGLKIGDVIDSVNFTQNIYAEINILNTGYLNNLTVKGTYKAFLGEGDNIVISENPNYGQKIYISLDMLDQQNMEEIQAGLLDTGNFNVLVKIDAPQFSVGEPSTFNNEVDQFINQITRDYGHDIQGINIISSTIIGFQIFSVFLTFLYVILAAPVILLSLYLLNFGLEMSLEERRRLIAIKKVQGANSKQIFSELVNEMMLLLLIGSVIGYLLGIFAAWIIQTATGFMELDIGSFDSFMAYLRFDFWAFILPFILVSLVLVSVTYKRGKAFINQEVTEGVSRRAIREEGYYKRNKIDVYVFIASLSGIILVVIQYLKIPITVSRFFGGFIFTVTPFMFWLGGSSVGSRLVRIIPLKLEGSFLRLPVFRDVKRIIKSGLRRRGDTERLAMIIILTLAIASLATIQGNTEEIQAQRELEWHVGADWQVNFVLEDNHHVNLSKITGFDSSIAVNTMDTLCLSSEIPVVAFENHQELINFKNGKPTLKWQQDTFDAFTAQSALQALEDTPKGIFLPSDQFLALDIDVGDIIEMKVPIAGSIRGETLLVENIEVLGVVSQVPGGIYFHSLISQDLFQIFQALSLEMPADSFVDLALNASRYLVRTDAGSSISSYQIDEIQHVLDTEMEGIRSHRSYYEELAEINTKKQGYGITGLLSLDFIISLLAVIISAFSFTAILMERRKQEFAILRAIGAKKKHIYKMALGENSLMMMTATIWGIFIGVGVAYLFNGIFLVIGLLLGSQSSVNRMVVLPLGELAIISVITFIGMLIATLLSVRSAANQDLSLATKVV